MRVKAVLFAALAERLGVREEWLELTETAATPPTAADVYHYYYAREPRLGCLGAALILAVNAEFCPPDTPLHDGDEVALLPPMSGGSGGSRDTASPGSPPTRIEAALVRAPLSPPAPFDPGPHGAVVCFEGVVRNHTRGHAGRTVMALEYEAYEAMAQSRLTAIAADAATRWELTAISLIHRLGRLIVGEVSVRVLVAAPHRAAAFEACRFAIDTLKQSVPIWKREFFTDGAVWADGEFPK